MNWKSIIVASFWLASFSFGIAQNLLPAPWTNYCGWHYGGGAPGWGGWAREYAKDRFGLFISDSISYQIDSLELQNSYNTLAAVDSTIDLLQLEGGLGSARDTARVIAFMDMIEADNGEKWKRIVYTQSKKLTELPDAENRVYWQIGNEITSPAYSKTIRYWQGQPYGNGLNYDQFIIPYYVENYFAPTVEAIDSASLDVYGQKGMIKICLGSLTNAHNPAAQIFLDSLLNYQIQGSNAPSLAGKKVYELPHLITIHYTMGTSNTSDWLSTINAFKSWTGTGRIEGVWSTEEVGITQAQADNGAFASSIVTSRYLEWAIDNQYSPKAVRTNYFGWNTGDPASTVNAFNTLLFGHFGACKLFNTSANATLVGSSSPLETHSFKSEAGDLGAIIFFPERIQGQNTTASISTIKLDQAEWGNIQSILFIEYAASGFSSLAYATASAGDTMTYSLSFSPSLTNTEGILVLLDLATPSTHAATTSEMGIKAYPNPAQDLLNLQLPAQMEDYEIVIFDLTGKSLISAHNQSQIALEGLSQGLYSIEVRTSGAKCWSGKFIKTE